MGNNNTTGLSDIQDLLQYNLFGHGTISKGSSLDYETWAFSGLTNPDGTHVNGVPNGVAMTVNDIGGFFNVSTPDDSPFKGVPFDLGPRHYGGNSLRGQALTLIHEIAHQIEVPKFQHDFGNNKAEMANNKAVDTNCRQLIEGIK